MPRKLDHVYWIVAGVMLCTLAWQRAPLLSLTLAADPAVATRGELLTLTFEIANVGDAPLEGVVMIARVPEHTALQGAAAIDEGWLVDVLPGGEVSFGAQESLAPGQRAQLVFRVTVLETAGDAIAIDTYVARAQGTDAPVTGAPATVWVEVTPTPERAPSPVETGTPPPATQTPLPATATPTATPTATAPTSTPSPTASPTPSPTLSPTPSPSPTITVVMVMLPPTPTPNLSSEQERLGALTVSIFVGFTLTIAVGATVWVVRSSIRGPS